MTRDIAFVQTAASRRSAQLVAYVPSGLAPYGPGANHALGVGQSFMAGAVTMVKLLSVASRLHGEIGPYQAKMVGNADRCQTSGATYDQFGPRTLNPLIATAVADGVSTPYSSSDIANGNFPPSVRGESPIVTACIMFEMLWREFMQLDGPDSSRFDVATNVAKTATLLSDISSGDNLSRTVDAARAVLDAVSASGPGTPTRLSVVYECHGQADNSVATATDDYMNGHKIFRYDVYASIAVSKYGQNLIAPWIAMQVGGLYFSFNNYTSQAQLNMGIDTATHSDYVLAGPDYPYPCFGDALNAYVPASHPWSNNRHPSANAQRQRGSLMARARFFVQVLKRNWFVTHVSSAWIRDGSPTILVGVSCMAAPIRLDCPAPGAVGLQPGAIPNQGFTVVVKGRYVGIDSVTKVDDNTIRIDCAKPFSASSLPDLRIGDYSVRGSTNIRDSFGLGHIFKYIFEAGYTDTNLNTTGYDDTLQLENVAVWVHGSTDLGNWLANGAVTCQLLPTSIGSVS